MLLPEIKSNRLWSIASIVLLALLTSACPKGGGEFKAGEKAETANDYDTALIHYERAQKADPKSSLYQIRVQRMRFEAAQAHVDTGNKLLEQDLLEPALAEFGKAVAIDPSSFIAIQQVEHTKELIAGRERDRELATAPPPPDSLPKLERTPSAPPQLKPASGKSLNLRMNEDSKVVFQAIASLAEINVIFDPDFQSRKIQVSLNNATVEEALDIAALMTKTFWKPVTSNTIIVVPDQTAKRQAYEEQIIKTIFLSNISEPTELNELVQALRQLLDIKRITPSTVHNAIIIRDTPDKVAVAEKIINDIDRAKPEVVIQVVVLQARRDRARDLGILPSTSVPLLFTPRSTIGPETAGDASGAVRLDAAGNVSSEDYSLILPSATAMALLTDSTTQIIQNPQIRTTDGQTAKLNIGDKVPFAVGSFQPGIGGVGINPLVNTQFQFQDVGVNIDVTPRVHANREISLKVVVEVSSVTGRVNIGGIEQPIFGQRKIEHDIRLKEGEVSILGGIVEHSEDISLEGWPGLSRVPFLRYFFSSENKTQRENEVLIVLTPRVIRLPSISQLNRRAIAIGTDTNISLPRPRSQPAAPGESGAPDTEAPAAEEKQVPEEDQPAEPPAQNPAFAFEPAAAKVKVGDQIAVNIVVRNISDLFIASLIVNYDPKLVKLAGVTHGGFMGGEDLPPALVHRINENDGAAIISISRPPGSKGASGGGTIVSLIFEGIAPGQSPLTISQIAPRDSNQQLFHPGLEPASITVE